jgi:hypothetical protein
MISRVFERSPSLGAESFCFTFFLFSFPDSRKAVRFIFGGGRAGTWKNSGMRKIDTKLWLVEQWYLFGWGVNLQVERTWGSLGYMAGSGRRCNLRVRGAAVLRGDHQGLLGSVIIELDISM